VILTGPSGAGKSTVGTHVARTFDPGVHLRGDAFLHVIARGFIAPWLPASRHQNETVQSAITAAATRYAAGGYTVVLDWVLGPWALEQLAAETGNADVDVHYVVLRPDEATCLARATARPAPELVDPEPVLRIFDSFRDLGPYERHVVDSTALTAEETAAQVLGAVETGSHRLVELGGSN
jgi:predicted kinase